MEGFLEERVLAPNGVFAKVPAVIAPKHDDGVVAQLQVIQAFQQPTHQGVGVSNTSGVMFAHFERKLRVGVGVAFPAIVFHELTRAVPRGLSLGPGRMRRGGERGVGVRLHVLGRRTKRQVRSNDAHGEKERFVGLGQRVHLLQGLVGNQPVGIHRVRPLERLIHIHVLRVLTNLTIGQSVHRSARMLPRTGWQQVACPSTRHFRFVILIPIWPAATAGMMRDFPNRHRRVAMLAKPSWKTRVFNLGEVLKKRPIARGPVTPCEQRVPRGTASRRLYIVPMKCPPARRQRIDIRRVNVIHTETFQLRPQVIHTNK